MKESIYRADQAMAPIPNGTPDSDAYWIVRETFDDAGQLLNKQWFYGPGYPDPALRPKPEAAPA